MVGTIHQAIFGQIIQVALPDAKNASIAIQKTKKNMHTAISGKEKHKVIGTVVEVNRMRLITLTRKIDGAKMYVNPEQICAVYQYYKKDSTVIQFAGEENNFIEVVESPDSIASVLQAQV